MMQYHNQTIIITSLGRQSVLGVGQRTLCKLVEILGEHLHCSQTFDHLKQIT